jgi:pyrroline-5-carboxylate reductase
MLHRAIGFATAKFHSMHVGLIGAGNVARAFERGSRGPVLASGIGAAVPTPGGTTARRLAALECGGVRPAFQKAFDAVVGWAR